jgi:CRISPR-associated protein Cas1
MSGRTIEISASPAYLSLRQRQLVLRREDGAERTTPIEDLGLLIVDQPQVTYSHALLAALAEAKVATVICGADHMPAAVLLPYAAHAMAGEKLRAQLECSRPLAKRLWQAMVACKLRRQADLLERATGDQAGLRAMADRVRSGDPDNLEAQGAQRYWPRLMGREFRRDRGGAPPNNLLNYGYAVLRAATARAIVGAGLLAGVGLFHRNRGDAFALASDLMEPFRPFVDGIAWEMARAGMAEGDLDRPRKAHLLAVLNLGIAMDGQAMPLSLAVHRAAASLAESFAQNKLLLRLPEGPAGLPDADADEAAPPPAA